MRERKDALQEVTHIEPPHEPVTEPMDVTSPITEKKQKLDCKLNYIAVYQYY